ncbi:uncharacterized protein EMH_0014110 [Eimeria mitis]|uniref:Uncharacterized protein n=1 Tax=Eimeria mitis TaxID=44415 RepID=U6K7W9_9EIME|nr:uncharacterized protein EMH_0014110 [Eimeria mitis]CDJ32901.1 hypothetical protein, conserved [Eimeria mitis]
MDCRQWNCFSAALDPAVDALATHSPSLATSGARMAAEQEERELGAPSPSPTEDKEITYFPTGKAVLASGADWELRASGDTSVVTLSTRLRQCLCIDRERMEMFRIVFEEEREELERYLEYMESRLLLYPAQCMQTLPMMQSFIDELKAEITEAHSSLQTVEGIAIDVKELTGQLTKEYDNLFSELRSLEQGESPVCQQPEVRNSHMPREADNGTAGDLERIARLQVVEEAVSAKEIEHRMQLTISFTENKRKELVEVGNSVFPSSLNALAPLWAQLFPTAPEQPAAPPPTPNTENEGSVFSEQVSAVGEPQQVPFLQPSAPSFPQQPEVSAEVSMENPTAVESRASNLAFVAPVEAPGPVSELPGTLVPRRPHEIRRGRSRYRRMNPLVNRRATESCCHGDPTFVYSADERSPSRSSNSICSVEKEEEPLKLLRCNSSPHGSAATSSSLDLLSSTNDTADG